MLELAESDYAYSISTMLKFAACSRTCAKIYAKLIDKLNIGAIITGNSRPHIEFMGAACWIKNGSISAIGQNFMMGPEVVIYQNGSEYMIFRCGEIEVHQGDRMMHIDIEKNQLHYKFNRNQGNKAYIGARLEDFDDGMTNELFLYAALNKQELRDELGNSWFIHK